MIETYIRTSKHSIAKTNKDKLYNIQSLIKEYRRVAKLYLNYLWDLPHTFTINNKTCHFSIATNNYELPMMLSTTTINDEIKLETLLTARVLKCCITQVLGIVRGTLDKRKRQQYIINKKRKEHKTISKKLREKVRTIISKPDVSNINPELNSICYNYKEIDSKEFNGFAQLKSIFKDKRGFTINIPVQFHRQANKLKKKGELLNSILLTKKDISLRWEIPTPDKKKTGKIVGADQGMTTVLTLSTQATPETDRHGYSLTSIVKKLARKRKASKAFRKTQTHRKNFIHWSINRLNFKGIKTIKFENVKYLRFGKNHGRTMSHWTYPIIKEKISRRCEEEKVSLILDTSCYFSQRCNKCGLVLKSNRIGKTYSCKNCGIQLDADFNSAFNHQQELCAVPNWLRKLNLNRKGFFWKSSGFYRLTGEEITVSLSKNKVKKVG